MTQHDNRRRRLPEADPSHERIIRAPTLPREEVVETTERMARAAAMRPAFGRERSARRALLDQLTGRRALRQAIVLGEILGPPRALRRLDDT